MSATLLVLAAGLGSRFKGGIKQITPVGASGELLMEYSAYDAVQAGFDKIIFILRKDIEQYFCENVGKRLSSFVNVDYCFQEFTELPGGFVCPSERTKPWGTVHAVLAAKNLINEPFLIINADDYYGKNAYKEIYNFLINNTDKTAQCMGGFILKNTLSPTGAVTRGVCTADENCCLSSVTETYKTIRCADGKVKGEQNGMLKEIDENSVVSMNMWGCKSDVMPMLEKCFIEFLEQSQKNNTLDTAEYALPLAFDKLIRSKEITVAVIPTNDIWYGMTYSDDRNDVITAIKYKTKNGEYPLKLFNEYNY